MTTLREAAQQALEALEELNGWQSLAPPLASQAGRQAAINLRAALEQPEQPNECHWYQDGDEDSDKWAASCGRHRYFQLNDGTPTDNRMTHCCYCGKPLVEVPIEPEDNHE
jgi:hypothetical protein